MTEFLQVQRALSKAVDLEDRVVSALHQGALGLRSVVRGESTPARGDATFAVLFQVVTAVMDRDPALSHLLQELPSAPGASALLNTLFEELCCAETQVDLVRRPRHQAAHLTTREIEVLWELDRGRQQKEIAAVLKIHEATVRTHVGHIHTKLGVSNTQEALNRAKDLGLEGFRPVERVRPLRSGPAEEFSHLAGVLLRRLESGIRRGIQDECRALASLGALLLLVAGIEAGLAERSPGPLSTAGQGAVLEYNSNGKLVRVLEGGSCLGRPQRLAFAPTAAANQGFVPGHLFVADGGVYSDGLNEACVAELANDGRCVRLFTGGSHFSSRLGPASGLAFSPQGMLLYSSGECGAVLQFSEGGAQVRRLVSGVPHEGFGVDGGGRLFLAGGGAQEETIQVFDGEGNPQGSLEWGLEGEPGAIALDREGRIYVSGCGGSGIRLLDRAGAVIGSFDHPHVQHPRCLAAGPPHRLYVLEEDRRTLHSFDTSRQSHLFSLEGPPGMLLDGLAIGPRHNLFVGATREG